MAGAAIIQFQKKEEAKWLCSSCGADRDCNCNAPAVERLAEIRERARQEKRQRKKTKENKDQVWQTGPNEITQAAMAELDSGGGIAGDTPEEIWYRGLCYRAGEAIAGATTSNWRGQYGDYSKFKVSTELVTLAEQASLAWRELANHLRSLL